MFRSPTHDHNATPSTTVEDARPAAGRTSRTSRTSRASQRSSRRGAAATADTNTPTITIRGIALDANGGEDSFRAVERQLALLELVALREAAAVGVQPVVALLGMAAAAQNIPLDQPRVDAGVELAQRYVAWVGAQPRVSEWYPLVGRLQRETAVATLPPTRIAELRALSNRLPPSLRDHWRQVLQDLAPYDNQRDNDTPLEDAVRGGTCNLTATSMALAGMGYQTDPVSLVGGVLAAHPDVADRVAQGDLLEGPGMRESVEQTSGNALTTWLYTGRLLHEKAFWTTTVRAVLESGYGVLLSARHHVTRLQRVDMDALVVDDPAGLWNFDDNTWQTRNHHETANPQGPRAAGEDNRWPFPDALREIRYIRVLAPRSLLGTDLTHRVDVTHPDDRHLRLGDAEFVID